MLLALAVIVGTIVLGAALAFLPGLGPRALGVVRSFALSAAIAVVVLHLLPDAIEAVGPRALLALAIGVLLPVGLERALGRRAQGADLAFEVGFLGLLAHAFGDGVAFWAFAQAPGNGAAMVALGAHIVPVTTVLVLRDAAAHGVRRALARAAALLAATAAGLWSGEALPPQVLEAVEPWVAAVAGGLLLHVVAHEVAGPRPRRHRDRSLELLAVIVGAVLSVLGAHGPELVGAFGGALQGVASAVALPVLLGFGLALAIERRAGSGHVLWMERAGAWISVGLVVSALVQATVPPGALGSVGWAVSLAMLVILGHGNALAAAPLAVVLVTHTSPAWVFVALVVGPLMTARANRPGILKLGVWAEIAAALLAMAGAQTLVPPLAQWAVSMVAAAVLAALLVAGLWHAGIRGWIASLGVHTHATRD